MPAIIESKSVSINLREGGTIPEQRSVLLVSSDLQARVKLEAAVAGAGVEVVTRRPDAPLGDLAPESAVLDLDQLGEEGAARWAALLEPTGARLLGFFSHIDEALGRRAGELGIEAIRRGRFWRMTSDILAGPGPRG